MNRLRTYLRERFPIGPTSAHALATAALLIGVTSPSSESGRLLAVIGVAVAFFFFMLRMRVTDEFKDAGHDDANYPNRPVQRGAIFKRDLVVIGIVSLFLELAGVWFAGFATGNASAWVWYLPILGYSFLTGQEFFVGEFLERHFNLYFIVHQAIFALWLVWGFQLFASALAFGPAVAFFLLMISMEVVRKYEIRRDPSGQVVLDTYLAVWGRGAFWVLLVNVVVSSILLSAHWLALAVGGVSVLALLVLRKNTEAVRAIAAVSFLANSAVVLLS